MFESLRIKLIRKLAGKDISMLMNADVEGCVKPKGKTFYLYGKITPAPSLCSACGDASVQRHGCDKVQHGQTSLGFKVW